MDRVIKFRAWDKDDQEMCYQDDVNSDHFILRLSHTGLELLKQSYSEIEGTSYKETKNFVGMQFTGLHDKNGKEIYEGDLWKRGDYIGIVVFKFGAWTFDKAPLSKVVEYPSFYSNFSSGEVIGNIFETPELLKGA